MRGSANEKELLKLLQAASGVAAAQQITSVDVSPTSHALQAGPSYALLAAYAIGVPCLAAWLLRRRDA